MRIFDLFFNLFQISSPTNILFKFCWKDICDWSEKKVKTNNDIVKGVITFKKQKAIVVAYLYMRKKDGSILKSQIPMVNNLKVSDCPVDIQNALSMEKEILVHDDVSHVRKEPIIQINYLKP